MGQESTLNGVELTHKFAYIGPTHLEYLRANPLVDLEGLLIEHPAAVRAFHLCVYVCVYGVYMCGVHGVCI